MALHSDLRQQLRNEANAVKDCFTQFSFQALAFSTVVLGIVLTYQPQWPPVGLVGPLVTLVLLTVSRIGGHKYATANRHFAYELYHDTHRTTDNVGWEEAQQAWRVVTPAIFDALHVTRSDLRTQSDPKQTGLTRIKRRVGIRTGFSIDQYELTTLALLEKNDPARLWFHIPAQVKPLVWHPGRYLEQMQSILHIVATISLFPVIAMAAQLVPPVRAWLGEQSNLPEMFFWVASLGAGALAAFSVCALYVIVRQLTARRRILEEGMLSIPASAVVWRLTLAAHRKAKLAAPEHYLSTLAALAQELAKLASYQPEPEGPQSIWEWLAVHEPEQAA